MKYNKVYGKFLGLSSIHLSDFKTGEPLLNSHLYIFLKLKGLGNHKFLKAKILYDV